MAHTYGRVHREAMRRAARLLEAQQLLAKADASEDPVASAGYRERARAARTAAMTRDERLAAAGELLDRIDDTRDPVERQALQDRADELLAPDDDEPTEGDQADADEMLAKADAARAAGDWTAARGYRDRAAEFLAGRGR